MSAWSRSTGWIAAVAPHPADHRPIEHLPLAEPVDPAALERLADPGARDEGVGVRDVVDGEDHRALARDVVEALDLDVRDGPGADARDERDHPHEHRLVVVEAHRGLDDRRALLRGLGVADACAARGADGFGAARAGSGAGVGLGLGLRDGACSNGTADETAKAPSAACDTGRSAIAAASRTVPGSTSTGVIGRTTISTSSATANGPATGARWPDPAAVARPRTGRGPTGSGSGATGRTTIDDRMPLRTARDRCGPHPPRRARRPRMDPDRPARVRARRAGRRRRRSRRRTGRRRGCATAPTASAATANGPGSTGSGSGGDGEDDVDSLETANGPTTGLAIGSADAGCGHRERPGSTGSGSGVTRSDDVGLAETANGPTTGLARRRAAAAPTANGPVDRLGFRRDRRRPRVLATANGPRPRWRRRGGSTPRRTARVDGLRLGRDRRTRRPR